MTNDTIIVTLAGGPISGFRYEAPQPALGNVQEFIYGLPGGDHHLYSRRYGGGKQIVLQYQGVLGNSRQMLRDAIARN